MVAVVSGYGLGLFNASNNTLGSLGVLGNGLMGEAGGMAFVNAATGNLVLQFQDEHLSGLGDISALRTYNSLGTMSDGLGADWSFDGEGTVVFTPPANLPAGTNPINGVGSTITRTLGDGSQSVFTWNATLGLYTSDDGAGAMNTLSYDATNHQWIFTDGSTRELERYGDTTNTSTIGRLLARIDNSGNEVDFGYDSSSRLTTITDKTSGQYVQLVYGAVTEQVPNASGGTTTTVYQRLVGLNTFTVTAPSTSGGAPTGTLLSAVKYDYDVNGRLQVVTTELTANAGIGDGNVYTTNYAYDATGRLTGLSQSDGTNVAFAYDAQGRIAQVSDAGGTQNFAYNAAIAATATTPAVLANTIVTDGAGNNWTYFYDSQDRLAEVDAPAPADGAAPKTVFAYDARGNVTEVSRSVDGNVADNQNVVYQYDARDNQILQRDSQGDTIARFFDPTTNQLVYETHYATAGQGLDPTSGSAPSNAQTAFYVYDSQARLRFSISAQGRIVEYRYTSSGQLATMVEYAGALFDVTTVSTTVLPTLTALTQWAAAQDQTKTQQTLYTYDVRGNLASTSAYDIINSDGSLPTNDPGKTVTNYTYDAYGRLLQTVVLHGTQSNQPALISFGYDGLGRLVSQLDAGGSRTTSYAGHTITMTSQSTGLVELRSFDSRGRLISVSDTGNSTGAQGGARTTRTTQYFYDAAGRLTVTVDPQGNSSLDYYDADGRLQYNVNAAGAVCGYAYNGAGQLLTMTCYANIVTPANLLNVTTTTDNSTNPPTVSTSYALKNSTLSIGASGADVTSSADDRVISYSYDAAGRQITATDGAGTITTTRYDGESRVSSVTSGARQTQYFYDADGNQVGVLDPRGYLTEMKYDGASQLIESTEYATKSAGAINSTPVWIGVVNQTVAAGKAFSYRLPAIDADGNPLTYTASGLPSWLTMTTDAGGVTLSGSAPLTLTSSNVSIVASDGHASATASFSIAVVNSPPTWVSLPDVQVAANSTGFTYKLPAATDDFSATLTYSITSALPTGLTFSGQTISGTPTVPGAYTITAKVTDSGKPALSTLRTFVLQVTSKGPVWQAVANQPAMRTQAFSFTVPAASDPQHQALTYKMVSGPSWLTFDPIGLTLSGMPPASGSIDQPVPVVLQATDSNGEAMQVAFSINLQNAPPVWPANVNQPTPTHVGSFFNYQASPAVDPEGGIVHYQASGLPSGLNFDATTGAIWGIVNQINNFPVTIFAIDADGASSSINITISITDTAPTYSSGISDQTVEWGVPTDWSVPAGAFIDPDSDALGNYFLVGAAPPGLVFNPSGAGQGGSFHMFTTVAVGTTYQVTVGVADQWGVTGQHTFNVTVIAQPPAPPAPLPPPPPPPPPGPPRPPGSPPIQPFARVNPPSGLTAPIGDAPAPTLIAAPAAAVSAPLSAPPPDPLAAFRPAASADDLLTFYFYDGEGRLVGEVNPEGFLTQTVYDVQDNRQQTIKFLNPVTVNTGANTDTLSSLVSRATSAATAAGTVASETTTTQFDTFDRIASITGVDGTLTSFQYDAAGRLIREILAAGSSDQRAMDTRYNDFNEVTGSLGGVGDGLLPAGFTEAQLDAVLKTNGTQYTYDADGEMASSTDANGHITLFLHDAGNRTDTIDASGAVTETLYNAFGEVSSTRRYNSAIPATSTDPTVQTLSALQTTGGGVLSQAVAQQLNKMQSSTADEVEKRTYEHRGLVATVTDAAGYTTSDSYDQFGDLFQQTRTIALASGSTPAVTSTTEFDYDLDGNLISTTANLGGINFNTQRSVDAFGRVTRSVDAAGNVTTTTYLNGGSTVQVQDPLNRKVTTQFDAFNRVTSIVDPLGNKTSYKYDDVNRTLTMTEQPLQSGVPGFSVVTTQTRAGETLSVTDARGTTTSYTYNADGQVTSAVQTSTITDSAGKSTTKTATLSTDQYDNSGRLKSYTDALGTVTQLTYDAVNRVITKVTDPGGLALTTKYSYDNFGRVTTEVDGANTSASRSITYKYDVDNRETAIIIDPNGLKLQTLYKYDGLSDVLQVSQGTTSTPNQQVTQYVFDKLGRQIQRIDAPSSIVGAGPSYERDLTTQYRYNAAGEVSRVIDADGNSTWYLYDAGGELHQSIDALGNVTELNYDADDRLISTRRYANPLSAATVAAFGDVAGGFSVTPSSDDARSYFVYDNDGRQVYALTAKDANTWSVTQKFYDANGNVIESVAYDQYIPDAWIQSNDSTGTSGFTAAQVSQEITSLYAAPGVTQAHVERTYFVYDASNRLRYSVDALGDVSESIYDNAGNVIEQIRYAKPIVVPSNLTEGVLNGLVDRNNVGDQIIHYSYDRGGRLRYTVQVLSSDGAGNPTQQIVTERDYDVLGQVTQIIGYGSYFKGFPGNAYDVATIGKALTSSVQDRRAEFAYDAAGRQVFSVQVLTIPGANGAAATVQNFVTQNTFDAMGHVTQTTVYANPMALTAYDRTTIGNTVNAHTSIKDRTTRFVFDADGRERFTVMADGSLSENVYDALGRLTEARKFDILVPSGTAMTESALENVRGARHVGDGITRGVASTYDADGEVATIKDAAGNVQTYTYDARGNMRTWTDARGALWTYSYDRLGHQIGIQSPQVMLQLEGDSQTKSYSLVASLTYDAFGNLTTRTDAVGTTEQRTTGYAYDVLNRHTDTTLPPALVQLSTDAAPAMHSLQTHETYDALGNVTSSTEAYGTADARETDYAYDALGRMTQVTLPGAYDPVSGHVVAIQKDAQGNAIVPAGMFRRNTLTTYDAFGDAVSSREQTGTTTYQYVYSTFDTLGRQTYAVDAMGYVTGFTYDAFGDQQTVTRYSVKVGSPASILAWDGTVLSGTLSGDTQSRTVTTQYDAAGRKILVQLPAVNDYFESSREFGTNAGTINPGTATPTTTFQYDAFGDLIHQSVQMDSRTQETWRYYDAMGREILTVDPMGFQTARTYDANGNLTFVTQFANAGTTNLTAKLPSTPPTSTNDRTTEYDYDAVNQQTSVERLGWSFTFWNGTSYQLITNASNVATPYSYATYDSMGKVRTQIDALSNATVTDYNLLGQAVSVTEPTRTTALMAATVQSVTVPTHSLVSGVSTGTMTVNVIVGAHAVGDPFVNLVNAAPVTTLTRDAFGEVVREDRNPKDGGPTRTTLRSYDLAGNLTSSTDPNTYALLSAVQAGNASLPQGTVASLPAPTVSYAYDFAGRLTDQRQVIQTSLANFTTVNQVLESRYAYDALGRQTDAVKLYNGGTQQTGQHQNYNGFGELTATYKIWGSAGTPIASLMQPPAAGGAPSYAIVASYTYDNDGRMQTQTTSQGVTNFYYDLIGDVTREEQRGLQVTTNADGSVSVSASTDPNLPVKVMESGYDILGHSVIQRLPVFGEGAGIPGENPFTVVSYDRWGNVASRTVGETTDANGNFLRLGNTTYYTYNWDNQVTSVEDPLVFDERADGTSYDALVTHTTGYDMLGREVLQSDSSYNLDSGGTTLLRTTNIRHYNQAGELTSQTDSTASNVTTSYAYDGNGDQVGAKNNIGGVLVDSFDNNGNLVTHGVLRLPGSDGNPADGAVYVSGVSAQSVLVLINQYQYDQANRRVGQFASAENNARVSYTLYDERNLVTTLEDGTTGDAGQGGITTYQYDQFGNRIAATDPVQNTQTWTYRGDAGDSNLNYTTDYGVGQLTRWAAGQVSTSYFYNGFGQESSEVYTNSSNPVLAGESIGRAFSYYVNGSLKKVTDAIYHPDSNVVTRNITSYQYTSLGQVSQEAITQNSTSGGQIFINGGLIQTLGGTTVTGLTRTTNTVYDADGRVIDIWSPNGQDVNGIAMSSLQYRYDELGDRREIVADYFANHIQVPEKQQWFTYDSMGRMLIVDGALQNGQIVATSASTVLTYDALGQRASAYAFSQVNNVVVNNPPSPGFPNGTVDNITWSQFNTEHYTYNDLGYLTEIKTSVTQQNKIDHITTTVGGVSGVPVSTSSPTTETGSVAVVTADYAYDLGGEMISNRSYDIKFANGDANSIFDAVDTTVTSIYGAGGLKEQDTTVATDSSKNSKTTYQYDKAGNLATYQYVQAPNTSSSHETDYQYNYTNEFGGEKLTFISENTHHGSDLNGGTSDLYDERGNMVMQSIVDPGPGGQQAGRQDSFGYDTSGQIISQFETANAANSTTVVRGSREYFYDNGTQIAALGSDFLAGEQIDNNFTPISAQYPAVHPNSYTVNNGDTLAGIAQRVLGDPQLWYLIAQANNLNFGPNESLVTEVGKTYRIPTVINNQNDSNTTTPYNPYNIIGPTAPSPYLAMPSSQCSGVEKVVAVAVIVAATIAVTALTQGAATEALEGLGPTWSAILGQGIGAAAGSFAGQATAVGLGQERFQDISGWQILAAGASASATSALGFTDETLGGRLVGSTLDQAGNVIAGGSGDPTAATQGILDGLLSASPVGAAIGPSLSKILSKVGAGALDPSTGWVFNRDTRGDWESIVGQAIGQLAQFSTGPIANLFPQQSSSSSNALSSSNVDPLSVTIQSQNLDPLSLAIQSQNLQLSPDSLSIGRADLSGFDTSSAEDDFASEAEWENYWHAQAAGSPGYNPQAGSGPGYVGNGAESLSNVDGNSTPAPGDVPPEAVPVQQADPRDVMRAYDDAHPGDPLSHPAPAAPAATADSGATAASSPAAEPSVAPRSFGYGTGAVTTVTDALAAMNGSPPARTAPSFLGLRLFPLSAVAVGPSTPASSSPIPNGPPLAGEFGNLAAGLSTNTRGDTVPAKALDEVLGGPPPPPSQDVTPLEPLWGAKVRPSGGLLKQASASAMNTASAVFPNVAGGTTEDNLGGYRRTGEDIARERALNNKNPSRTGPRPPEGMVQGEGPTVEGLTRESFTFKRPPNIAVDRGLGQQIGNKGGSWDLPTGTRGPGNPTGGTGRGGPSGTGRGGPSAPGRGNPSGGVPPEGPVPVEGVGVGGTLLGILGLLSIAATIKSVLYDATHGHLLRGLETAGTAGGMFAAATLAAKLAPKVFTPTRLGVYGVAASAVLDVYKNTDAYATEGYNFAVSAFKAVGMDAHDHPYAGTAAAIGYVVGASVTRAAVGAIKSLLEPSELIEGTAYDPYTAMMIGP